MRLPRPLLPLSPGFVCNEPCNPHGLSYLSPLKQTNTQMERPVMQTLNRGSPEVHWQQACPLTGTFEMPQSSLNCPECRSWLRDPHNP